MNKIERKLYELKMKIIRSEELSEKTIIELCEDIHQLEKLIRKKNSSWWFFFTW